LQKPRGQFTARVQAVGPDHFGILSVDVAKARSKFMFADFYGNVLIPPTLLTHAQGDFAAAIDHLRVVLRDHHILDLVVAIERTGTYHRPVQLAFRHAGFETRLVHPFATKQYRQPADPGNKTDDTDLAAIFRATANGFGLLEPDWPDEYLQLQQLVRQRRDLVHKSGILRCQIQETLHQLMPGYVELFRNHFFDNPVGLRLARACGSAAAIVDAGLLGVAQKLHLDSLPPKTRDRVFAWARMAPAIRIPGQWLRYQLDHLSDDLLQKTREIRSLEQQAAHLLVQTPYGVLLALPGLAVVCAADLAAELGPIAHYANANGITGRAGLAPSRYQSDQVDRHGGPLRRRGNRRLRAALTQAADNLMRHNPYFRGKAQVWQQQGRDPRWIHVKLAKSFSRLAFVVLSGGDLVPHPACQPRHSITEKILAFHSAHQSPLTETLADIDRAAASWPERLYQEELRMVRDLGDNPGCRRCHGPRALAQILPEVLARLGTRVVQSKTEGQDPV
jgi:transposase